MSTIDSGLRADIMRKRMEDKNTLEKKGSIYVGTGVSQSYPWQNALGQQDEPVKVCETSALEVAEGQESNYILTTDSTSATGLKWANSFPSLTIANLSAGDISVSSSVNVTGSISASSFTAETIICSTITASSDISASGDISALTFTASSDISASGDVSASNFIASSDISVGNDISITNNIIAGGYASISGNVSAPTFNGASIVDISSASGTEWSQANIIPTAKAVANKINNSGVATINSLHGSVTIQNTDNLVSIAASASSDTITINLSVSVIASW